MKILEKVGLEVAEVSIRVGEVLAGTKEEEELEEDSLAEVTELKSSLKLLPTMEPFPVLAKANNKTTDVELT